MIEYPQNKHIPDEYIIAKLSEFWNEDMPKGDLATECTVPKKTPIKAEIQALQELVFVGKKIIPNKRSVAIETPLTSLTGNIFKPPEN